MGNDGQEIQKIIMGAPATVVAQGGIAAYIIKKLNDRFRNAAREATDTDKTQDTIEAMSEALKAIPKLEQQVAQIEKNIEALKDSNLAQLRNSITNIFYRYINAEYIPFYEHENQIYQRNEYDRRGGNSYVSEIVPMILAKPVCTEEAPKEGKHYEDQLESKNQKSAVDRSGVGRCRSPYTDLLRPDGGRYDHMGSGVGSSGESDK